MVPIIILLIMLALGILYCFWGYKYLKVILFIFAFFIGMYYSYTLIGTYFPQTANWLWLISIIVGLIVAFLSFFFVKFAIFIVGGLIGLMVYDLLRGGFPETFASMEQVTLFFIGLGLFVVFGVITLASRKHFIILFSSIYGSYTIITAVGGIIGAIINPDALGGVTFSNYKQTLDSISVFNQSPSWMFILPIVAFSIAGIIAQYKFTASKARNRSI